MTDRDASKGSEEQLLELLMQWREGSESERKAARTQINELVRSDETHRATMAQLLVDETLIDQELRMQSVESLVEGSLSEAALLPTSVASNRRSGRRSHLRYVIAASVVALLVGVIFWFNATPDSGKPGIRVIAAEGVGTLDIERLQQGEATVLQRGILELELNGEARVVLEAPTTFNVLSPKHIQLSSGRCFVEMAEGNSGLLVETPTGEALDLGTRFAVHVPSPEKMEVHVFDGAVDVSDSQGTTRLTEGEGLEVEESGDRKELPARPEQFVSRVPRTRCSSEPFLFWSFDEAEGDRVAAEGSAENLADAAGILRSEIPDTSGPTFVEGVSGTALEFNGTSQWVSTDHPGISGDKDRTVACWVRLPSDWERRDRAPLISRGLKDGHVQGAAWMLHVVGSNRRFPEVAGRPRLSVGGQAIVGSTDLRSGRWHHLAVVYVREQGEHAVLLYVDGRLQNVTRNSIESVETETTAEGARPISFGRRLYGAQTFMRGALDEVYVFQGALSGDQIRDLMTKESR